jgi:hypothetical protein
LFTLNQDAPDAIYRDETADDGNRNPCHVCHRVLHFRDASCINILI